MRRKKSGRHWIWIPLAIVALSAGVAACRVTVDPQPSRVVVGTSYYAPLFHNGYVVYYDSVGRPIYYVNGVRYFVPRTHARYDLYLRHYRRHRRAYRRWYRARGHRYRRYRRRRRRRKVRHRRRRRRR